MERQSKRLGRHSEQAAAMSEGTICLRPMSEAPRDGTVIMARRKPNRGRRYNQSEQMKRFDIKIRWFLTCWRNMTVHGDWLADRHLEGWWPYEGGQRNPQSKLGMELEKR